jgi:hypothetical protein
VSRYRGPATLINSGGSEVVVYVDLRSKQREWSGTVTVTDFDADDPHDRTLRLPDGREGQVTLGGSEAWSDVITLVGSGPPPFA